MKLTAHEVRAAYYVTAAYRRSGRHVPPSVAALCERLDREIRFGVSPTRHESDSAPSPLGNVEWIGTRLAAELLGWSLRRVQRHAADLDGRHVGGRLIFPRNSVEDYRDELNARNR